MATQETASSAPDLCEGSEPDRFGRMVNDDFVRGEAGTSRVILGIHLKSDDKS